MREIRGWHVSPDEFAAVHDRAGVDARVTPRLASVLDEHRTRAAGRT